jgi:glycine cleavage system H lipoate-binding protein
MFPFVHEFQWNALHITFLLIFFTVAVVVATTVVRAMMRSRRRLAREGHARVSWHSAFEELPSTTRVCRHQMNGEVRHRTCENEFACANCPEHQRYLASGQSPSAARPLPFTPAVAVSGIELPTDRYYDRGHTWARIEPDGSFSVGVDEFGRRLLGRVESVELPPVGTKVATHAPAIQVRTKHGMAMLRSPIDGEVTYAYAEGDRWKMKVKMDPTSSVAHLLRGPEIGPWLTRELERLQMTLSDQKVGFSLADGGVPVESMPDAAPKKDWEAVWGEMFLEA